MDVKSAITRARRGLREERRLYIVAVTSLAVAFLCLGATLLGVTNLDAAATGAFDIAPDGKSIVGTGINGVLKQLFYG